MSQKRKQKGGAEKLREKHQKLREAEAASCSKISQFFTVNEASNFGQLSQQNVVPVFSPEQETHSVFSGPNVTSDPTDNNDNVSTVTTADTISVTPHKSDHPEIQEENQDLIDYFSRPQPSQFSLFFKYYPRQNFDTNINLPFVANKTFRRNDGTQRHWLSFNVDNSRLYCTVCLVFSDNIDKNVFTTGMNDWKHIYQRILEHERSKTHNTSVDAYFRNQSKTDIEHFLFGKQLDVRSNQVRKKRQILERVIDVIKVLGKRGLSFRGSKEEAAYSLKDPNIDHGNFLELLILLSKYDVILKEHFNEIISKSEQLHAGNKSKGRGSLVTLISKTTLDLILHNISDLIKKTICNQIAQAEMFSVQLDTTQDISVKDQCSVIIRYVSNSEVHERLISVVNASDTTGKGIFEMLLKVIESNNLSLLNCVANVTDGAANMQGKYKGFSSFMENFDPEKNQVHVWCHSHLLNLVLTEATSVTIESASLFSLINAVAVLFKESYKRMNIWKEVSNDKRVIQVIGETRWWAKETALCKIFGHYGAPANALYVDILFALQQLLKNIELTPDVRAKCRSYLDSLLKYETILTAHIYLRIFSIVGPVSRYLQTSGLDLLTAQKMTSTAIDSLEKICRDFENTKNITKNFIDWANSRIGTFEETEDLVINEDFTPKRVRRIKRMYDEKSSDDPIKDVCRKFEIETYNTILDTTVEVMKSRFQTHNVLYTDLSLLSPKNFTSLEKLPDNAFQVLSRYLVKFNKDCTPEKLSEELISFSKNWDHLKMSVTEKYSDSYQVKSVESMDDENNEIFENVFCAKKTSCKNCPLCCYNVIIKYNLFSDAYATLALAYKYLLTLPVTQVACERSFSKLKYIKTRLRSSMTDDHLETFMLMAIEKDIMYKLDCDEIIDNVAEKSNLLRKLLVL